MGDDDHHHHHVGAVVVIVVDGSVGFWSMLIDGFLPPCSICLVVTCVACF